MGRITRRGSEMVFRCFVYFSLAEFPPTQCYRRLAYLMIVITRPMGRRSEQGTDTITPRLPIWTGSPVRDPQHHSVHSVETCKPLCCYPTASPTQPTQFTSEMHKHHEWTWEKISQRFFLISRRGLGGNTTTFLLKPWPLHQRERAPAQTTPLLCTNTYVLTSRLRPKNEGVNSQSEK
jgi:hypothetical protein